MRITNYFVTALAALLVYGCGPGSLSDTSKQQNIGNNRELSKLKETANNTETTLQAELKDPAQAYVSEASSLENWSQIIASARDSLSSAQGFLDTEATLLKENNGNDQEAYDQVNRKVVAELGAAAENLKKVNDGRARAKDLQGRAFTLVHQAHERWAQVQGQLTGLKTEVGKSQSTYPRVQVQLATAQTEAVAPYLRLGVLSGQLDKLPPQKLPQYVVIDEVERLLTKDAAWPNAKVTDLESGMADLGRSYTKRLLDQRISSYSVTLVAVWGDDGDQQEKQGPFAVDEQSVQAFITSLQSPEDDPAPVNEDLAKRVGGQDNHDGVDFYATEVTPNCQEQYQIYEDGIWKTTDWQDVDPDTFDAHQTMVGMDIETKPIGFFASETTVQCTPPGLTMVGDTHYGTWVNQAGQTSQVWQWSPQWQSLYAFDDGYSYVYTYADYVDWRERRTYTHTVYVPAPQSGGQQRTWTPVQVSGNSTQLPQVASISGSGQVRSPGTYSSSVRPTHRGFETLMTARGGPRNADGLRRGMSMPGNTASNIGSFKGSGTSRPDGSVATRGSGTSSFGRSGGLSSQGSVRSSSFGGGSKTFTRSFSGGSSGRSLGGTSGGGGSFRSSSSTRSSSSSSSSTRSSSASSSSSRR